MAEYWRRQVDGKEQVRTGLGWRAVVPGSNEPVKDQLPIVDLSDMCHQDIDKRRAVAKKICDACIEFGFFYASKYGIPDQDIFQIFSEAKRFFTELSVKEKMELDTAKHDHYWGYYPRNTDANHPAGRSEVALANRKFSSPLTWQIRSQRRRELWIRAISGPRSKGRCSGPQLVASGKPATRIRSKYQATYDADATFESIAASALCSRSGFGRTLF